MISERRLECPGVASSVLLFPFPPVSGVSYPREHFPRGCLCAWRFESAGIPRLRNSAVKMPTGSGLGALGMGSGVAPDTRGRVRAAAWHATACLFSAAACSRGWDSVRLRGGGAASVVRCVSSVGTALPTEGHGDGETAPGPPRGRGLPGPP